VTVRPLPRVAFYFRFFGDVFDPDEITRRIGIEPTTQFRPGDPITEDGEGSRRGYGWFVKVGYAETLAIDDLIQELRIRIDVSPSTVRQVCKDLDLELKVVCGVGQHESEATPALCFPPDFLEWLTELGAGLDIDVIL
jgi:hypothetical protein